MDSQDARLPNTTGQVITCKAAVAWGPKQPLKIEEVQVAPPGDGEVRIRILFTSVCRSDLTFWKGEGQTHVFPRIFGHEAAGIVESVGEGVTYVKPGDHVIPLFSGECQECKYCRSGKTNICMKYTIDPNRGFMVSDNTSRFSKDGKPIYHFVGTSTFSEYTVVDQGCVVKVDPRAPLEKICLLSCGVTTGLGASINTAGVERGSTVAIFGLGTIGFAAAQGAKIAGASRIIGVDINPSKKELAKKFGVTDFLNPLEYDKPISEVIKELTEGGVDYAIECIGNTQLMEAAFASIHDGYGKTVITGLDSATKRVIFNPVEFLFGRVLTGSFFGGYKGKSQLGDLVQKYMNKELQLDDFITHEMPFEKINEAFELLDDSKCLRCILHLN
ncbi:hypothetical protein O6H91_05G012700 [Diphasiastrum complanatum]|uniref:Uncharacterized protein n=4 Tax=Diphasiastrum complanatum TaxID=34168 RepID=A0ACC2DL03_DIPCM|nr:hypothetical protein O6H91_05G012000 [Diphasiastrum complanatum]KAJ7554848.1 hypothetical protein O6H91_05G012000 [Diphasiastrum complanatum]KAJ7554857.1 hypothetical protein O6H91_05G012700 [Diphasiastrum complanatum]KAJ7554858.1 hypothetical protein O6H91_05G012700 [Diphasiastrum complanatum]